MVKNRYGLDANGNGLQDDGEIGVREITVELRRNGVLVASTTTDLEGFYNFPNVAPGTYVVVFQQPNGFEFTVPLVGTRALLSSQQAPSPMVCDDLQCPQNSLPKVGFR